MLIDTSKIDAAIKALQELKRLASDPAMAPILNLLRAGANKSDTAVEEVVERTTNRRGRRIRKGDLIDTTRSAIGAMGGQFTGADILTQVSNAGFRFKARNPQVSINGAIRKLATKGEVRLVQAGSGRTPNVYEKTRKLLEI